MIVGVKMTEEMRIRKEDFNPKIHVKEYKRKCNECGKVWHSLAKREEQIQKNIRDNACYQGAFCCNPGAQLQAKRNWESGENELNKLKKCPECGSQNFSEEAIIYFKHER